MVSDIFGEFNGRESKVSEEISPTLPDVLPIISHSSTGG